MKTPYNSRRPAASRRGFALIITIVLVAFLVLILVGLATFTRVETQVADNGQQLAKARQNALLALNIAVGQLQKTTGPDQRVTATADLQPIADGDRNDPASGEDLVVTPANTASTLQDIANYWNASRNRHWVGAWTNGNTSTFDANDPAAFNPVPELQAWLVSGNETVADRFKPTDTVPGVTFAALDASGAPVSVFTTHPADPDASAARTYRLLVGKNTAGIAAAADIGRAVFAPQVKIESDSVPGLPGDQTVGHYAWWVGDEGVKAKANIIDAYASGPSAEDNRTRLLSAQRPALEVLDAAFDAVYPENSDDLKKLLSNDQWAYLSSAAAAQDEYKPRYHDLTLHSRGVLSDTRHGGLRADLSHLLSRADLGDFRTALNAALPDAARRTAASDYNPLLSSITTPYAVPPPRAQRR